MNANKLYILKYVWDGEMQVTAFSTFAEAVNTLIDLWEGDKELVALLRNAIETGENYTDKNYEISLVRHANQQVSDCVGNNIPRWITINFTNSSGDFMITTEDIPLNTEGWINLIDFAL